MEKSETYLSLLIPRLAMVLFGAFVISILLYAAGIKSPFEWDEILFARAVEHYDAATNSPHMPGYPAFVLATRIVALAVHDAVKAVQITSLIAAVLALILVFITARKLGLEFFRACLASAVVALCPCFLWFSGTGLSDAAGALSCCAVFWAVLHGGRSLRWTVLTGVLAALAVGIRSQAIYVLAPLSVVALIEWRTKTPLRLVTAAGAAFLTSVAIWLPAILLTGPSRWWAAFLWQLQWVRQERINGLALPYAKWAWIEQGWFIRPFGTAWLAAFFWLSATAGAIILWRSGRRRIVLYCLGVGSVSLLLTMFSLDLRNGSRYILPSLVFFSFLIAGGTGGSRWRGRLMAGATALFMIGSVAWVFPGLALRRSESSPVIRVLEGIRAEYGLKDANVLYEEKLWHHTEWMLGREGYEIHTMSELEEWSRTHQKDLRSIVAICSHRGSTAEDAAFRAE
ncbi:MAG: hypothetical protein K8R59_00880 [Thermoanaerobaculales bacterium]|nr:hypothetical protein [Thermoanaerobaculales bacterium]